MRPCSRRRLASFPIVVVLPVPLTPTTRITLGCPFSPSRPGSPRSAASLLGQRLARSPSSPRASRRRTSSAARARRRRRRSTPPRVAPRVDVVRGSKAAAAICSFSARRLFPSESRSRENKPACCSSALGAVRVAEQLCPRISPRPRTLVHYAVAATGASRGTRRETIWETPSAPIVTPYRLSAASIVRF